MRLVILTLFSVAIFFPIQTSAIESEIDSDFDLWDDRAIRVERSYGALGGPLAASIREKKPKHGSKENASSEEASEKPYVPVSNNNGKKCGVRTRVTIDRAQVRQKASKEFDEYVKKYKKTYPSEDAKEKARNTFIDGRQGAYALNEKRCSNNDAQFSTTKYSDWTTDDFVQKLAGAKEDSEPAKLPPPFTVTEDESRFLYKLPRLDWRDYGVISPVRNQLQCGSCYAFSTTDLLSAQERIDKKKLYGGPVEPYSAQYIVDCMPEPYGYGCKGGRPAAVLEYMASCSDCTLLVDRCYEYRNKETRCKQPSINCRNEVGAKPVFSKLASLISSREAEAMATLLRAGPAVAVVALSPAWQYYNGKGIIREGHCGKKSNHAILIVGYDYTGDVPYYFVKNSWDTDYGAAGYVKVEAGKNTCGIASAVLLTCTDKKKCGSFKEMKDFAKHPNIKPSLKPDGTYS